MKRLVAARELLWSFVERDLIVRYRTPVFGIAWAIATPLTQMMIVSVVFAHVGRVDVGMPYPLFAYIGLTAWTLTAAALRGATTSLSSNAVLVTKVPFPREILPLAAVCAALLDFVGAMALTGVLMWHYGQPITPAAMLFPIIVIVHLAFVTGLALLLAVADLFWRDVRHVLDVLVTVWMFASGVVYPVQGVGGRIGALLAWNPMTQVIEAYRDVIVRGRLPEGPPFLMMSVASLVMLIVAWTVFHRSERQFAELA